MKKDKNKQLQKAEKKETSIVRSSAAEYLTFVTATGKGGVEAVYADENIWLSQKMMGVLYDVNVRTVNEHLKKIFADSELQEDSVIRKFRITATDGKNYNTLHYNLSAIIAVGYKVNSERAVQFRKWATTVIKEYTIKAYVMDDERIILAFFIGLVLLVWSADRFVEGSASTARHFGMPPLLIGMVIVGFGTSAPEIVVSALASIDGNAGIALGNAYGSNICNIALILGVSALINPFRQTARNL